MRYVSQMIEAGYNRISGKQQPYGGAREVTLTTRFMRSKLAPFPGSAINLYYGENVVGEKSTVKGELVTQVTPLSAEDIYDAIKQDGSLGFVKMVPAIFGVGVGNYDKNKSLGVKDLREKIAEANKKGHLATAENLRKQLKEKMKQEAAEARENADKKRKEKIEKFR